MSEKVNCIICGTKILSTTAEKNSGLCMPCRGGYRNQIDAGKLYAEKLKQARVSPERKHWEWLVNQAKLRNAQNRLGFFVSLGRELAEQRRDKKAVERLANVQRRLEDSRLVAETTLGRESMSQSERAWVRANRPPEARHWNVLTTLTADQVRHVP